MAAPSARVSPRRVEARPKPNLFLLAVLAVVLVLAIARVVLGSLGGGATIHSFKPIVIPRSLVRGSTVPARSPGQVVVVARSGRDPFAPPAGYSR